MEEAPPAALGHVQECWLSNWMSFGGESPPVPADRRCGQCTAEFIPDATGLGSSVQTDVFHLMGEAELSSICPRLGECPLLLLSLLAGGCPPVTTIPTLPQGSLPAAARGEPCRTQQHTIKPQLILPCFCRGLKVTQMKQLSIKAGCCVNMH